MNIAELLFYILLFIANTLIAIEWGKYGYLELGLQGPRNKKVLIGMFMGAITVFISGIVHRKIGFTPNYKFVIAVVGIPLLFIPLMRRLMPGGQFEFNRARERILYWAATSHSSGIILEEKGALLREFPKAKETVRLLRQAISAQEKYTDMQCRLNAAIGYEELGFLYRMMNMWEEAELALEKSLSILEGLEKEYPNNREISLTLSTTIFRQAEIAHARGRTTEAIEGYKKSLAIDEKFGDDEGIKAARVLLQRIQPGANCK